MPRVLDDILSCYVPKLLHCRDECLFETPGYFRQWAELPPKQIQLLREIHPSLSRVGHLHDTKVPSTRMAEQLAREAALKLGIAYIPYYVANRSDLDRAFAQMEEQRPEALLFGAGSGLLTGLLQTIVEALPCVSQIVMHQGGGP